MFGLIEARDGLYGFRDLAAARQVAQLLGSGIVLSVITRSLRDIRKWLPDARLSNLRLFPESSDKILVEQVLGRTDSKGQFVLPVAKPRRCRRRRSFRAGASRRGGRRPQHGRKPLPARHETRSERSGGGAQSRQSAAGSAAHGGGGSRLSVGREGGSETSRRLGTIWQICLMKGDDLPRRLIARSARSMPIHITPMPCSTWRCSYSGLASTQKRRRGGRGISNTTARRHGPSARNAH